MTRSTRTRFALAAALVAAIAMSAATVTFAKAPVTAPALHLPGRMGPVDSDSLHARLMVVDFWASWCVPCRRSFPFFAHLDSLYGSRGLVIVAVNLDKKREDADAFLARFPAPFRVAFDPSGKTAEAYHVNGMPTTYLVGGDGRILDAHAGFDEKSAAALETQIARTLTP